MEKYIELNSYVTVKLALLLELKINDETKQDELDEEFVKIFELEHRPTNEIHCIANCVRNQLLSFAINGIESDGIISEEEFLKRQKNFEKVHLLMYRFLKFINEVY